MRPVFLIGYMGCGKTTLGEALAREMGVAYVDLDEFIERQYGCSIIEIFDEMGEKRFREIEADALREVAVMKDVIVGCGGGTPCYGNNMELMNAAGLTVWLTTSPERITARLLLPEQKCKRPKIVDLPDDEVLPLVKRELLARERYYCQAQWQFDSTDIETAATTRCSAQRLAQQLLSLLSGMES